MRLARIQNWLADHGYAEHPLPRGLPRQRNRSGNFLKRAILIVIILPITMALTAVVELFLFGAFFRG